MKNANMLAKVAHYSAYDYRTGCRIWTAAKSETGYGLTRWKGKQYKAHRLAWEAIHGDIQPGVVIHHKCARRLCVNPAHLQAVSSQENAAEMMERNYYLKRIADLETQVASLSVRCPNACTCATSNIL